MYNSFLVLEALLIMRMYGKMILFYSNRPMRMAKLTVETLSICPTTFPILVNFNCIRLNAPIARERILPVYFVILN